MKKKIIKGENPEVDELLEEIGVQHSLRAVADSEGGKLIIKQSKREITALIDELCGTYKKGTHPELVSIIAKIEARTAILRILLKADKNVRDAEMYLEELTAE